MLMTSSCWSWLRSMTVATSSRVASSTCSRSSASTCVAPRMARTAMHSPRSLPAPRTPGALTSLGSADPGPSRSAVFMITSVPAGPPATGDLADPEVITGVALPIERVEAGPCGAAPRTGHDRLATEPAFLQERRPSEADEVPQRPQFLSGELADRADPHPLELDR